MKMQELETNIKRKMKELLEEERLQTASEGNEFLPSGNRRKNRSAGRQSPAKNQGGNQQTQTLAKEAQKRSQEQIQIIKQQLVENQKESWEMAEQLKEKETSIQRIMEGPEKYVMETLSAQCFTINHNTITKSGSDRSWRMVLLDVVAGKGVLSFRTYIHNRQESICIGVTDRVTQKERTSAQSEHCIFYGCKSGYVCCATGDDQCKQYDGGVRVDNGMELLCEVERDKQQVTFTVFKGGHRKYRRQVRSRILSQPHREFVPFFEMYTIGESISWELQ